MSLINPKSIEDLIIAGLAVGERETTELLYEVRQSRSRTTKQGFYAALRQLKSEDVVAIRSKTIALNTTWLGRMQELIGGMAETYLADSSAFSLLSLKDKERATFYFSNTRHLDTFWGHSQSIFMRAAGTEPIYAYDEHYWIYIARQETEKRLLEDIARQGRQFLMSVGGDCPLDRLIKRDFDGTNIQYNLDRVFAKDHYNMTVIGDYITEVTFSAVLNEKLEALYGRYSEVTPELIVELDKLLEMKGRHKIRISRDATRAEVLKRRLGREFYILKKSSAAEAID